MDFIFRTTKALIWFTIMILPWCATATIGGLLSGPLVICVQGARGGRPNWSAPACGTSRTWTASMKTPSSAVRNSSRERFLTELTLDPPDATSDQAGVPLLDEDYLILSTIHSAK